MTPLEQEIQAFSWIAAGVAAFVTAGLAIVNFRNSIQQRQLDLRWRQAKAATEFVHEMHGQKSVAAAIFMFDWLDTAGPPQGAQTEGPCITRAELLGIVGSSDATKHYILHCLDWLFYYIDRAEQNIRDGFFEFDNVKYIFLPYYEKICKDSEARSVFDKFSLDHRYLLAPHFWERFDGDQFWKSEGANRSPTISTAPSTAQPYVIRVL